MSVDLKLPKPRRFLSADKLVLTLHERRQDVRDQGFSETNLQAFRSFYLVYPLLVEDPISHSLRGKLVSAGSSAPTVAVNDGNQGEPPTWQPGKLSSSLSWTHYRTLLKVRSAIARSFYEIEAIENSWSARELERQINSLLFERLAKSKVNRIVWSSPI